MTTTAFDTLAIARRLKAAGFSEEQAEAVTGVIREARDIDLSALVTKADLSALPTKADLSLLATKTELSEAKFEILKWVLSAIGFQAVVIVGAIVALSKGVH